MDRLNGLCPNPFSLGLKRLFAVSRDPPTLTIRRPLMILSGSIIHIHHVGNTAPPVLKDGRKFQGTALRTGTGLAICLIF